MCEGKCGNKETERSERVIYTYDKSGPGVVTFAYKVSEACCDGERVVSWGVALCSPKDNFSKKIGRAIAEGRLQKGTEDFSGVITLLDNKEEGLFKQVNAAIHGCYNQGTIASIRPRWLK